MNKEIMKIVNRVVSEEISSKISRFRNRLFEEKQEICNECGSAMYEGVCSECSGMYETDIQELGGMDDGHPRFGNKNFAKMSTKEKEDLMSDRSYEDNFDDDDDDSLYVDDYEEDNDEEYNSARPSLSDLSKDLSDYSDEPIRDREDWSTHTMSRRNENPRHFDSYKGLDEEECNECGDMVETDLDERLYGKQHKLDRNKNGKLDRKDFAMLRNRKKEVELEERLYGKQHKIDKNKNGKIDSEDFKILRKESKVYFTESEMIDVIENIVKEEKKKTKSQSAKNVLKSSMNKSKKENDDYIKSVSKKMKEYLKDASKGEYEENPSKFPKGNYDLDKRKVKLKKYIPSDAVDEYIDAFSYPGMTNLVFDEIKPTDEKIEKYLKGDSTTGNAQKDKDGNALGNVEPSENGDKFFKNYQDNLYGQEQMNASYKRQPQPVDQAGEETERGTLKSKRGKKSSQDILNAVDESIKTKKVISEMEKMKNLIGYNRKTQ